MYLQCLFAEFTNLQKKKPTVHYFITTVSNIAIFMLLDIKTHPFTTANILNVYGLQLLVSYASQKRIVIGFSKEEELLGVHSPMQTHPMSMLLHYVKYVIHATFHNYKNSLLRYIVCCLPAVIVEAQ